MRRLALLVVALWHAALGRPPPAAAGHGADVPEIIIVSQATPNITDYAAWSMSINKAYSKKHGYAFYVDKRDGEHHVRGERDVRWSKVAILKGLIEKRGIVPQGIEVESTGGNTGAGKRIYFWIDADAVFVDFNTRLENILSSHADKGMIICREGEGGTLANTGTFFLKEDFDWGDGRSTRNMLQAWWDAGKAYPQTLFKPRHEQHALELLANSKAWLLAGIQLEPTDSFNTVPPFYATTTKKSFVMHLMHEPYGRLREEVFKDVYSYIDGEGERASLDMSRVRRKLCFLTEKAYVSSMVGMEEMQSEHGVSSKRSFDEAVDLSSFGSDEDLIVLYAQLLTNCYGVAGMGQALELYQHATRIAPADPDTHRLYASRILQFFESDAMGAEHVCGAEQSLQTAMSLESNPRRIDEIRELIPAARQACEKVGKQNWLFTKGMEIWSILAGTVMSSLIVVTLIAIASGALEKTFVQQKFSTAMRMSSMHGTLMEGKKTASAAESASLDADDVKEGRHKNARKGMVMHRTWPKKKRLGDSDEFLEDSSKDSVDSKPSGWGTDEWQMGVYRDDSPHENLSGSNAFSRNKDSSYYGRSWGMGRSKSCSLTEDRPVNKSASYHPDCFKSFDFSALLLEKRGKHGKHGQTLYDEEVVPPSTEGWTRGTGEGLKKSHRPVFEAFEEEDGPGSVMSQMAAAKMTYPSTYNFEMDCTPSDVASNMSMSPDYVASARGIVGAGYMVGGDGFEHLEDEMERSARSSE